MIFKLKILGIFFIFLFQNLLFAKDYFVDPTNGNDNNSGLTKNQALKTLKQASTIDFQPGDRLLLASGQTYNHSLNLINKHGTKEQAIIITSYLWDPTGELIPATIDFKGEPNGILIENCSYVEISNIKLTANGYFKNSSTQSNMRCGILVKNSRSKNMKHIVIKDISIFDVYYENYGFQRGKDEVKTANGTQKYGWGIRLMNDTKALISEVKIKNCSITNVSHTGIKLTGSHYNITDVEISGNIIAKTGGPGIQMSEVKNVFVTNNLVTHSGNDNDTRKWGRGSGLWTWGSSKVLIEKNKFLYANGPGDSAGAHIDFNCDNIVLQYNLSAYNAGGFCEILGNNYNCSYRYNISINDGHRVKGVGGAFQEGKIFWLSGYQGQKKERKGPVNSYFYNNTIYADSTYVSKIAIDNTSKGILIANNIFYLKGGSKAVLGDQYKPDEKSNKIAENIFFTNNLFLDKDNWPEDIGIKDISPLYGNPKFINEGSLIPEDYIPVNFNLVKNKGIKIVLLKNDTIGLLQSLKMEKDFLGNDVNENPSLGAIEPIKSFPTKNQ